MLKVVCLCEALLLVILISGCGNVRHGALRTRAAFDFNCPEDQLTLIKLDTYTRGVTGCGQKGTYVLNSTGQWVLNSVETVSGAPPAQTPAPSPASPNGVAGEPSSEHSTPPPPSTTP